MLRLWEKATVLFAVLLMIIDKEERSGGCHLSMMADADTQYTLRKISR